MSKFAVAIVGLCGLAAGFLMGLLVACLASPSLADLSAERDELLRESIELRNSAAASQLALRDITGDLKGARDQVKRLIAENERLRGKHLDVHPDESDAYMRDLSETLFATRGKTVNWDSMDADEHFERLAEGTIVWQEGVLRNRERNYPDGKPREARGEILLEGQWVRNGLTIFYDRNGRPFERLYYDAGELIRTQLLGEE